MRSGGRAVVLTLVAAGVWLFATPQLDPGTADFVATPAPIAPAAPVVEPPPLTPEELAARVDPTVVTLSASAGFSGVAGTGFVVAPDGIVLTNFHVVENATEISAVHM
ncbi:MAG: peptidase S1, partial [Rhodococcus sp. (in: high G+C Gram-positive bacteria)]